MSKFPTGPLTGTGVGEVVVSTGSGASYNQTIEDEGTPVTQRSTVNFTGAGVSVADTGGKTTVTISGGVPVGGSAAQYLSKVSSSDFDTAWTSMPTTVSGYGITDAVTIAGSQTITGVKIFQPATDVIPVIIQTSAGGSTATKLISIKDASNNECFSVTGAGNVTFTNSFMARYGTLNHPSAPDLYWGTNFGVTLTAAVYAGGSGSATYRLSRMAGNVTVDVAYFGETSPTQITSNQNNYALPTGAAFVRMSSDASRNVTGLVPPAHNGSSRGGQRITIANVGSNDIVFKHESTSSTAANRIIGTSGSDVTLAAGGVLDLIYDATSARWRVVG